MKTVRTLAALWIAWGGVCARAEDFPYLLRTELSKNVIYEGEQVMCNFVLYAREDALEVEVGKFPEFRGFWSDNLALRQGPLPLQTDMFPVPVRRATIGTYVLTPMVNRPDTSIEPMRLVIRSLTGRGFETRVLSEQPALQIRPLPPLPPDIPEKDFRGAVGNFGLTAESTEYRFEKGEPFSVRLSIHGEGNFPEVNTIELVLPPEVEILSRRSHHQGLGQQGTKTFEISLLSKGERGFEIPSPRLVYFNPVTEKYEIRTAPAIRVVHSPRPLADLVAETGKTGDLGAPATFWQAQTPPWRGVFFWLWQALAGAGLGYLVWREANRRRLERYLGSREFFRRRLWDGARAAWEAGRWLEFLRRADELAFECLRDAANLREPGITRAHALAAASRRMPQDLLAKARHLFEAHNRLAYSGRADLISPPDELLRSLDDLVKRAA